MTKSGFRAKTPNWEKEARKRQKIDENQEDLEKFMEKCYGGDINAG